MALMMLACVVATQTLDARGKKPAKRLEDPPACPAKFDDSPESNGVWKFGKETGVTPPKLIHSVDAEMSDEAREAHRNGLTNGSPFITMISLKVDKQGLPSEICAKRTAGYGLDAQAGYAVSQYRFEPATKDGQPVAVRMNVEVSFHFAQ
jgi:Gram-negative bacterial TonB protein C-terminal